MEMNKILNLKLALVSTSLLTLSLIGNGVLLSQHKNLQKERDKSFLELDSLLSAKLSIDKDLDQSKAEIFSYKKKNVELQNTMVAKDLVLNSYKSHLQEMQDDNATVKSLRKKLNEYEKLRDECEKLVNEYIKENERLSTQNNILNQSVNKLSQQLEEIKVTVAFAKNLKVSDISVLNYKVSTKRNTLTSRAKRVNRVSASFVIDENPFCIPGTKEIYMVVYDSKGNVLSSQDKKFIKKSSSKEQIYSTSKSVDYKNEALSTRIDFLTEQKLLRGKYHIELYIDGNYSGKKEFILK